MSLAGLQLQANSLGLKWQKVVVDNPDQLNHRTNFNLELAEQSINQMAAKLVNQAKNEKLDILARAPARRPGPLKVISAQPASDVHHFPYEIKTGCGLAFHRF